MAAHVCHDETDAGIKLAGMPLDLGDHSARLRPACRPVGEIGVVPPDLVRRPSDWALEQIADPVLKDLVGGQTGCDELRGQVVDGDPAASRFDGETVDQLVGQMHDGHGLQGRCR